MQDITRKLFLFSCLCSGFFGEATIVVNVSNCNIKSGCETESRCGNICQFSGLNAIGDIVKLKTDINAADTLEKGSIREPASFSVRFQKKHWQQLVMYVPTRGHMSNKKVSLLFYNIDLENKSHLNSLPEKMRDSIARYRAQNQTIRYALFVFKKVRTDLWQEISETYIAKDSPDNVDIPLEVYPDGIVLVTMPGGEKVFLRIDQMS